MEDCIIVGAGPAGLTAGIYMGRFLRRALILDGGTPRAAAIPRTHNLAGWPDGITGPELLDRMRCHAQQYGTPIHAERATRVLAQDDGFRVVTDQGEYSTRSVVLATGVTNHAPPMPEDDHALAVARGLIRYCPICDAFEARDLNIAVLGGSAHGASEAKFLRRYSSRVTLIRPDAVQLDAGQADDLAQRGISHLPSHLRSMSADGAGSGTATTTGFSTADACITVETADGRKQQFDTLYVALGTTPNAELAKAAGVKLSKDGGVLTDSNNETDVSGLFAVGDLIEGLDQISYAMGQAAVVATAIHNRLRD